MKHARKSLLEIFRRAKRERDYLLDIIAQQRVLLHEQNAVIGKQGRALRAIYGRLLRVAELNEAERRHRMLAEADEAERDETRPVQ